MTSLTPTDRDIAITGQVTTIWQRALHLDGEVPRDADFASLGGDSLLLLSIMDEVEETFGVELDVDAVIADLTVAGMVRAVLAAGD